MKRKSKEKQGTVQDTVFHIVGNLSFMVNADIRASSLEDAVDILHTLKVKNPDDIVMYDGKKVTATMHVADNYGVPTFVYCK